VPTLPPRVLVYGTGVSGQAAARHLRAEGAEVLCADDDPGERPRRVAAELGVELVVAPDAGALRRLAADLDEVVVSPGVPARHPVFALASELPVVGEVELAWRRARVPVVAVTGTNGKTTVVTLVARMLEAAGRRALCAGNIGLPLLDAVDGDAEVLVVEVSSFQLALTSSFRPAVGAWVNFAPDHLDWHPSLEHYRSSKARLWANAGQGDVLVANAEDAVVLAEAEAASGRGAGLVTFGIDRGDYRVRHGVLSGPDGELCRLSELRRPFPHEIADGLCAAAASVVVGASRVACGCTLRAFGGLPHRLELVGEASGVRFFDDSKATTPDAVVAALGGFDSAVLVAGGRNKGLDLSPLRALAPRLRGVVGIGEAAPEVAAVFAGAATVRTAPTMAAAVDEACALARPGDAVVLSPACTSFDWYRSYAERGEDFARCVGAALEAGWVPR
jgi:UDP-N-acetylmuramoylalanine--D-glutamate ligase